MLPLFYVFQVFISSAALSYPQLRTDCTWDGRCPISWGTQHSSVCRHDGVSKQFLYFLFLWESFFFLRLALVEEYFLRPRDLESKRFSTELFIQRDTCTRFYVIWSQKVSTICSSNLLKEWGSFFLSAEINRSYAKIKWENFAWLIWLRLCYTWLFSSGSLSLIFRSMFLFTCLWSLGWQNPFHSLISP